MRYFAEAYVQSGMAAQGLTLLLISIPAMVVGAILSFDLFGFVSKYRVPRSRWSIELQEKLHLPDTAELVGWVFLSVGVVLFVISSIGELILLVR